MNVKSCIVSVILSVLGFGIALNQAAAIPGNPGIANPIKIEPKTHKPSQGCDYRDAWKNNGWGWDAGRKVACAPVCDYSNASKNNGWGWNALSNSSCSPR